MTGQLWARWAAPSDVACDKGNAPTMILVLLLRAKNKIVNFKEYIQMGIYLQAYKADFEKVNWDLYKTGSWIPIEQNSETLTLCVKMGQLLQISWAYEHAAPHLDKNIKVMYHTFFDSVNIFFYEETYIDTKRYSESYNDDLGLLKYQNDLYWKSYNHISLNNIINESKNINYNFIENSLIYSLRNDDHITNDYIGNKINELKSFTDEIINIYKNCVLEEKGVIFTLD
ncbi:hypothetical protein IC229_35055 [Spirosoma sp. BT702]|uniref:Uncharacterized protein n=1 Tax=Spirosoma profusum TaxID=2771354 RepID=A0A927AWT1_9BACT|nr:hypothetical protein [Spirosoma profusum]MBD2705870.1 hypothetical protein [Spirosoma profusum]